jgi:hypothetical protein
MTGRWSPFELRNCVEWAWWLGALCLVAAAACLAAAVWPKTNTGVPAERRPAFFGDFARFRNARELSAALRVENHADGLERAADQLLLISGIVRRKYRFVKGAMILFGLATALCLGAALMNALLPNLCE